MWSKSHSRSERYAICDGYSGMAATQIASHSTHMRTNQLWIPAARYHCDLRGSMLSCGETTIAFYSRSIIAAPATHNKRLCIFVVWTNRAVKLSARILERVRARTGGCKRTATGAALVMSGRDLRRVGGATAPKTILWERRRRFGKQWATSSSVG